MKKLVGLIALGGLSTFSFGFINVNLSNPYQTANVPGSGSIFLTFSGTIDILNPLYTFTIASLETPFSGPNILNTTYHADLINYVNTATPGQDFTGNLFTVEVKSTDALGNYWFDSSSQTGLSEFVGSATASGLPGASDNEMYGVTVVPEPATLAALGIGAVALIRRRRNSK